MQVNRLSFGAVKVNTETPQIVKHTSGILGTCIGSQTTHLSPTEVSDRGVATFEDPTTGLAFIHTKGDPNSKSPLLNRESCVVNGSHTNGDSQTEFRFIGQNAAGEAFNVPVLGDTYHDPGENLKVRKYGGSELFYDRRPVGPTITYKFT